MYRTFPASLDQLYNMLEFVREESRQVGFDLSHLLKIELAAEEALVNIISYGYSHQMGEISIHCILHQSNGIKIIIKDTGIPFNPLKHQYDGYQPSVEERKIGGLGIIFIIKIMDEVNYERNNECNILTLIKYVKK